MNYKTNVLSIWDQDRHEKEPRYKNEVGNTLSCFTEDARTTGIVASLRIVLDHRNMFYLRVSFFPFLYIVVAKKQ
jgi:hypothetical protein